MSIQTCMTFFETNKMTFDRMPGWKKITLLFLIAWIKHFFCSTESKMYSFRMTWWHNFNIRANYPCSFTRSTIVFFVFFCALQPSKTKMVTFAAPLTIRQVCMCSLLFALLPFSRWTERPSVNCPMAVSRGFGYHNKLATDVPLAVLTSSAWRLPQYLWALERKCSQWPLKDRVRDTKGNPCSNTDPSGLSGQCISQCGTTHLQRWQASVFALTVAAIVLGHWVIRKGMYSTTAWFPVGQ